MKSARGSLSSIKPSSLGVRGHRWQINSSDFDRFSVDRALLSFLRANSEGGVPVPAASFTRARIPIRLSVIKGTAFDFLYEQFLTIQTAGLVVIARPIIPSVRLHVPGLDHVGEVDGKHLVMEKSLELRITHGEGHFLQWTFRLSNP
jgi:hypothetical protein